MLSMYPQKLQKLIDDFKSLENKTEKYEELLVYADELAEFPDSERKQENLVPSCTSIVYIIAELKDGNVYFQGDSDSYLVKGLVAVLITGLHGMSIEDFLQLQPDFITEFGLTESLSATRANASLNIFKTMQEKVKQSI